MSVLICKNTETEGPGTIEDFLRDKNIPFSIIELGLGETAPDLVKFNTLVVMGGPMAVYEMDRYPHLMVESRIIREAINRNMKVLGICLGAQMIAHCLGAEVYQGDKKEIGWLDIELTGDGLKDSIVRRLAIHPKVGDFWKRFKVFHWHGDTFNLPMDTVLLAGSALYRNQAFRYKNNVYAFQFHIEVTKNMLMEWFKDSPEKKLMMEETEKSYDEYAGRAWNFYKEFFRIK